METEAVSGRPFVCSWSGGKDSCLALYYALQAGGKPVGLLSVLDEEGKRSRSHVLPVSVLRKQAASLRIPLTTCAATWDEYEERFVGALRDFRQAGAEVGVFGDIDIEGHREWEESVCRAAGLSSYLPLWQQERKKLVHTFLRLGFRAVIVVVNKQAGIADLLGETLDDRVVAELERRGVDPAGEGGEFHTVVTGGPLFAAPVPLNVRGSEEHEGYAFLAYD